MSDSNSKAKWRLLCFVSLLVLGGSALGAKRFWKEHQEAQMAHQGALQAYETAQRLHDGVKAHLAKSTEVQKTAPPKIHDHVVQVLTWIRHQEPVRRFRVEQIQTPRGLLPAAGQPIDDILKPTGPLFPSLLNARLSLHGSSQEYGGFRQFLLELGAMPVSIAEVHLSGDKFVLAFDIYGVR